MRKVLIVGAGALGSELARVLHRDYEVTVMDADEVDRVRGVYGKEDIGRKKAKVLEERFGVRGICEMLDEGNAGILKEFDIIIEATDSFKTKHLVNRKAIEWGLDAVICGMDSRTLLVIRPRPMKCYNCITRGKEPRICSFLESDVARRFAETIKEYLDKDFILLHQDYGNEPEIAGVPEIGCEVCG